MSTAAQRASPKFTAWIIAIHVLATPAITWLAIVYSALGAPWREVHALWHAQAILLGTWCGISDAPRPRKRWLSLAAMLWLAAMPTAKELAQRGFLPVGFPWTSVVLRFGMQPLFLLLSFSVAALALAIASTLWPRWRVVIAAPDSRNAVAPQFSMRQLMIGITACTPVLLLVRLAHDHLDVAPVHDVTTLLVSALLGTPPAAAVAILSIWAALGRTFVVARVALAAIALPVAVFLVWYAEKYPASRIIGHVVFEETQLIVALATLLLVRWSGYRLERTE